MINFCMDLISLYVTARICRAVSKAYRLISASALGALYAVFAVGWDGVAAIAGALASSVLICLIAMKTDGALQLIRRTATFVTVSMLLGGISYCLYSVAGKQTYYNGTFYADVDAFPLILAGAASAVFILFYIRKTRTKITAISAEIKVELNGKSVCFTSLADSGLLLCDPISADPVILIKESALKKLTEKAPPETLPGFRLIPSERGLISAFRPPAVYVKAENSKWRQVTALIGRDTSDGSFSDMEALLPASLL